LFGLNWVSSTIGLELGMSWNGSIHYWRTSFLTQTHLYRRIGVFISVCHSLRTTIIGQEPLPTNSFFEIEREPHSPWSHTWVQNGSLALRSSNMVTIKFPSVCIISTHQWSFFFSWQKNSLFFDKEIEKILDFVLFF
jgi:hypothetical protein